MTSDRTATQEAFVPPYGRALDPRDGQTLITLVYQSDRASDDHFLYCNTKWLIHLLSLPDLIETGKGRPSPYDIPIFVGDTITGNTR